MHPASLLSVLALALGTLPTSAQDLPAFHAERAVRTAQFTLDTTPAKAFPLFTPLGELHWAARWDPTVLYPADGRPVEGLLFRTTDHGGMYWWLTHYEPEKHVIEYHAIVPDGFGRNIRVECKPAGSGTEVKVTDTYIGLSEHGNQFIRSLDEAAFARKIKGWEEPIRRYLKTGEEPKK